MSSPGAADDVIAEMRALVERFPVPDPRWHLYVPAVREVRRDLAVALDALAALPDAQAELLRHIDGVAPSPPADAGGPRIAAARARLRDLPTPLGHHPYLDEILVTLEAAEAALAALASAGGEAAFAAGGSPVATGS
jgi:hypothetical protein